MEKPISPAPVTTLDGDHLPAYISNGVIGLRVREIPLWAGVAVLNGLAGVHPVEQIEYTPFAPYPLGADLRLSNVWLSKAPECTHLVKQVYDFSCGELHTTFVFSVAGIEARVEVLTFCSRSLPFLVLQETEVEFSQGCEVAIAGQVDSTDIAGRWAARSEALPSKAKKAIDNALCWEPLGGLSTCGVAFSTELVGNVDAERTDTRWEAQSRMGTHYTFKARKGTRYRFRQIGGMVPSKVHVTPDMEAARLVAHGRDLGFDTLRRENREAWAELWKSRVRLLGASHRWQALADAAFFYLHSSVHTSSPASTNIFGLARWYDYNYYYGHVMWDIEAFAVPAVLLGQPGAARSMLDYRSRSLSAARDNAKLFGYRGLQYPWHSGPTYGQEAAPLPGTGSAYEQHVGLSVAHACVEYASATGDEHFLRHEAWPIVAGVAEWIASRVTKSRRGYEIRRVMGVAEKSKPSDNVAYMNMAASVVMQEAVACGERLGYQVPESWRDIARDMVIPVNPRTHVIMSYDDYRRDDEKGATPDPLAGLFPWGYRVDERVEKATLKFYLENIEQYVGSPMLSALCGGWAARLGDRALSARLFEEGYAAFVCDRFMNTHEYRHDKWPDQPQAGPFFANLAGFLMSCLYGLPGLRIGPGEIDTWCERPVVMPEGWEGVEVERLWIRDRPAHLLARHGDEKALLEFT